jgi:NADH:ubiquinone oxidoreductase subunit E
MLTISREQLRDEITAIADRHGRDRSSLIPILLDVKHDYHQVDSDAMQIIADLVGIHPVEVYSVASFYAFLHGAPEGTFVIRLCGTLSCDFAGKSAVAEALQQATGVGFNETSADGTLTLEWASCVGLCDQGPALLVNDQIHTRVTPERAREIVAECRATAAGR